jgi:hypothetical protein
MGLQMPKFVSREVVCCGTTVYPKLSSILLDRKLLLEYQQL